MFSGLIENFRAKYKSLKFRLILWYSLILILVFVIAEGIVYVYLDRELHKELDFLLSKEATELAQKIKFHGGKFIVIDSTEFYEAEHMYLNEASVFFRIFNENLNVVAVSEILKGNGVSIPEPDSKKFGKANEVVINGKRLRIFYLPIYAEGKFQGLVETSKFEGTVQVAMGLLRTSILFAMLLAFVVAAYGGNLIISKLINPLEQVIEKADKITVDNLTERIELKGGKHPEEIIKLVNALNRLLERLDKSFRQISQFTSDVAHEILTPLTIIKDEVEITLMKKRRVNEYIHALDLVQKQTDRTISIVKSMLYLAKADAGIIRANMHEVNVTELIRELVLTFNFKASRKNVKLRFYCDSDVVINTDEKLLFEALKNIVDNAIEYTNPGGKVEIICERRDSNVKITISDTGIGIDESELPYIFDRFYRGKNAFEINPSGTGLGLALTKSIVEILSGKIEVSSQRGKGTEFVVYIPEK